MAQQKLKKPKESKLDKLLITETALDLLNEVGFSGLTTRKLAEKLNVKSPALYWHFKNKLELLSLMREVLVQKCLDQLPDSEDGWQARLKSIAHSMRTILLNYEDSTQVLTTAPLSVVAEQELIPQLYQPLIDSGWEASEAAGVIVIITSYTLGWVSYEQSKSVSKLMLDTLNIDDVFSRGVETIIKGIVQDRS